MVRDNKPKAKISGGATTLLVVKPASPKKKKHVPNIKEKFKTNKEKPVQALLVLGFLEPLAVEAYEYTLMATKPGFVNNFRVWSRGELEVDALTVANCIGLKNKCDNKNGENEPILDADGYPRVWMIRYPPENESTPETRKEGLRVLKSFFMSKVGTKYPPTVIKVVGDTGDVPAVLEKFFLDDDIDEIIKASFDFTEMDDDFYGKYMQFARTIYSEKEPSDFAKMELGFLSL